MLALLALGRPSLCTPVTEYAACVECALLVADSVMSTLSADRICVGLWVDALLPAMSCCRHYRLD
jgi:hypothetical protein